MVDHSNAEEILNASFVVQSLWSARKIEETFRRQDVTQQGSYGRRSTDRKWRRIAQIVVGGAIGFAVVGAGLGAAMFIGDESSVVRKGMWVATFVAMLTAVPLLFVIGLKRHEIGMLRRQLHQSLSVDTLTSSMDGTVFHEWVDTHLTSSGRPSVQQTGAFLLVDADHLREINSRFGFTWGDEALRVISDAIRRSVREGDVVGRLGGDQFGMFLPNASLKNAKDVAARIQSVLADTIFEPGGKESQLTVTVGGIVFEDELNFDELIQAAGERVTKAKESSESTIIENHHARMTDQGRQFPLH